MRRACHAGRSGNWESYTNEFQKDGKLSAWASFKVRECYENVESEEKDRLSIAQDILHKSTDFLRRIIAPIGAVRGGTLMYVCRHRRLRTTLGGRCGHGKMQCNWRCAACGGHWRAPYRVLVIQDSTNPREAKVFRTHAAAQGTSDNLINSFKLLTNQQKDGNSPVENIVAGILFVRK